jgi:hypothetical protein
MAVYTGSVTLSSLDSTISGHLMANGWTSPGGSVLQSPSSSSVAFGFSATTTAASTYALSSVGGNSRVLYVPFGVHTGLLAVVNYQVFVGADYAFIQVRGAWPGSPDSSNLTPVQSMFGITSVTPYSDLGAYTPARDVVAFGLLGTSTETASPYAYYRNGTGFVGDGWNVAYLNTLRPTTQAVSGYGTPDNMPLALGKTQTTFFPYVVTMAPGSAAPYGGGIVGTLNNIYHAGEIAPDASDVQTPVNLRTVIGGNTYRTVTPYRHTATSATIANPLGVGVVGQGGPVVLIKE